MLEAIILNWSKVPTVRYTKHNIDIRYLKTVLSNGDSQIVPKEYTSWVSIRKFSLDYS
jgi:hypothetical protein